MRRVAMSGLIVVGMAIASGSAAQDRPLQSSELIFFDWGKYEIQRDYLGMLDRIATDALHQPASTLTVEGHSDRAGPATANRNSSLRRAEAVRDYLIGKGVSAKAIAIRAWGEERPLIATADGVREPQNRRVEIRMSVPPSQ